METIAKPSYLQATNLEWEDIDHRDYPDYSDAHIVSAEINGKDATEEELEEMNEDGDFKLERLMDYIF